MRLQLLLAALACKHGSEGKGREFLGRNNAPCCAFPPLPLLVPAARASCWGWDQSLEFWMQASRQEGFAAVSAFPFHQLRSRRVCWEQHEPGSHLCSSSGLSPVCSESFGGPGSNWPLLPEAVGCSWRDGGFLNPWRRRSPVGTAPLLPQVLVLPASHLGTCHPCAGIHGGLLGAQIGKDNGCSPVLIL